MKCPICQNEIDTPTKEFDVTCSQCGRAWYLLGDPSDGAFASRSIRVRINKIPQEGDKYTDCVSPIAKYPNLVALTAALDTLKQAEFHLSMSNLDDEGRLGFDAVKVAKTNIELRIEESRRRIAEREAGRAIK